MTRVYDPCDTVMRLSCTLMDVQRLRLLCHRSSSGDGCVRLGPGTRSWCASRRPSFVPRVAQVLGCPSFFLPSLGRPRDSHVFAQVLVRPLRE